MIDQTQASNLAETAQNKQTQATSKGTILIPRQNFLQIQEILERRLSEATNVEQSALQDALGELRSKSDTLGDKFTDSKGDGKYFVTLLKSTLEKTNCLVLMDLATLLRNIEEFSSSLDQETLRSINQLQNLDVSTLDEGFKFVLEKKRTKNRCTHSLSKKQAQSLRVLLVANDIEDISFFEEVSSMVGDSMLFSFSKQTWDLFQGRLASLLENVDEIDRISERQPNFEDLSKLVSKLERSPNALMLSNYLIKRLEQYREFDKFCELLNSSTDQLGLGVANANFMTLALEESLINPRKH